jgi:hypothetical protein
MSRDQEAQARRLVLRYLAESGNGSSACRRAGMSRATLHKRRKIDPTFDADWRAASAVAAARRRRVGVAQDDSIREWAAINPSIRVTTPPPPDLRAALDPAACYAVYVPVRNGAPMENPFAALDEDQLDILLDVALEPYPDEAVGAGAEDGSFEAWDFLIHWIAWRAALWHVRSTAPFVPLPTRPMPDDCATLLLARDPDKAAALDARMPAELAAMDWGVLLSSPERAGSPEAAPDDPSGEGDAAADVDVTADLTAAVIAPATPEASSPGGRRLEEGVLTGFDRS